MVVWKSLIFFLTFLQTLSDVRNLNFPTLFTQKYAQEVSISHANNCSFFPCFPIALQLKKKKKNNETKTNKVPNPPTLLLRHISLSMMYFTVFQS